MTTEPPADSLASSWEECMELLDRLPGLPLEERATAIEKLLHNPSPGVRSRALQVGAAILSDDKLVEFLRDDADAVRRNFALQIFKIRGHRSFGLAVDLLEDDDPDVVLQAVLILDHVKDPRAFEPLRAALTHADPNVVQEAIVAVGHLGDARAIEDLLPYLDSDPWLRMAAVQALGDLRAPKAAAPLARLLPDLMIGPMAAEALARIGGPDAFESLAAHWLRFHEELDPETSLGLLAHVVEGLAAPPTASPALRTALADRLRDPYRTVRVAAARCLLALGAGPEDAEALNLLVASVGERPLLPSCLHHRSDLVNTLLGKTGAMRTWGFLLAARDPEAAGEAELREALAGDFSADELGAVAAALGAVPGDALAETALDFYLRLPKEDRPALVPVLERYRQAVTGLLAERQDLRAPDRLLLAALAGEAAEKVVAGILELPADGRREVIAQLDRYPEIVRALPWQEWLQDEPAAYGDLTAQLAVAANSRELLPALRKLLTESPTPSLVRAVGELGDRESAPLLFDLLDDRRSILFSLVLDSLGRIGGPEVRTRLRELAGGEDPKTARLAYKALSECATEEDDAFFRAAVTHGDWLVRLAAAQVLGRFARRQNQAALAQLAADPVPLVAQRAVSYLES